MARLWITVLGLAVIISVCEAQVTCDAGLFVTYTATSGRRLVDATITMYTYQNIADVTSCFTNCKALGTCEAFNYNGQTLDCEVLQTDDVNRLQSSTGWTHYDVMCGTAEPETTPEAEAEPEVTMDDVWNYFKHHPEYIAMIGMGLVIFLLFITAIVILCCYTGGGKRRSDDYREKA